MGQERHNSIKRSNVRFYLLMGFSFLFIHVAFGQIVIETQKIDFVDIEKDYFYYKDSNNYKILDVELLWDEDNKFGWQIKHYDAKKKFYEDDVISYDDIKTIELHEFEQLFLEKKYILHQGRNKRIELAKFNKDHFIVYAYNKNSNNKWKLSAREMQLLGYCYIKLGNKYIIKLLNKESQYIIPLNEGFVISQIEQKEPQVSDIIKYKSAKKITPKDLYELIDNFKGQNFQNLLKYQIKKEDEGYMMYNSLGLNVLPEVKYDSIVYVHSHFITRKGGKYAIYKPTLEPISIKDQRDVCIQHHQICGITGNNYFRILSNEVIIYPNNSNWQRKREPPTGLLYLNDIIPSNATSYSIEKNDDFYYIRNYEGYLKDLNYGSVYIWEPDIDSLYFRNTRMNWHRQDTWGYFIDTNFIFKKDGKYGLRSFSDKRTKNSPFSLEKVLPPIFDNIEPYDDLNDIFNHDPDNDRRMYLDRDGLIGLYPIQKDVRYCKLKVYAEFARFMLPDKKQGWLNTFTGEEFIDE